MTKLTCIDCRADWYTASTAEPDPCQNCGGALKCESDGEPCPHLYTCKSRPAVTERPDPAQTLCESKTLGYYNYKR